MKFSEEIALRFLHMKNYKIFDALLSVQYDRSELMDLIRLINREKIDTGHFINFNV